MRILCLSPHLDDAILSCGQFLATNDTEIVTIFAGTPQNNTILTAYDTKFGFDCAETAMNKRREEDVEACIHIGANPVHLGYTDSQYGETQDREAILRSIQDSIERYSPELLLAPLGLSHPDHVLARDLAVELFLKSDFRLSFYEELPERVTNPEHVVSAKGVIENSVDLAFDAHPDCPITPKLRALLCYRSQLGGDINVYNLCVGERFWNATRKK